MAWWSRSTAALDELDRIHGDLGLAGVSFHTRFQGVPTDSPAVVTIVKRMAELGMTPFVHSGDSSEEALWRILDLARQVPDATIVVLDGITGLEQTNQACLVAQVADNLVFDTAGCPDFSFVARVISHVGASRVVFGSNTYSAVVSRRRGNALQAIRELPPTDANAILTGTISRILSLPT